ALVEPVSSRTSIRDQRLPGWTRARVRARSESGGRSRSVYPESAIPAAYAAPAGSAVRPRGVAAAVGRVRLDRRGPGARSGPGATVAGRFGVGCDPDSPRRLVPGGFGTVQSDFGTASAPPLLV